MDLLKNTILILFLCISLSCERGTQEPIEIQETQQWSKNLTNSAESDKELDSVTQDTSSENESKAQNSSNIQSPKIVDSFSDPSNKIDGTGWNWWMICAIISVVLNLLLLVILIRIDNKRNELEQGKSHYKEKSKRLEIRLKKISEENKSLLKEIQKLKKQSLQKTTGQKANLIASQEKYDDEKPVEYPLSVNSTSSVSPEQPAKEPVNLYAEKATEGNIFTSVSEQKNEHKSIFKLFLEDENAKTAKFEILDSEFILRMAANSPDTYLYTVCKPENSNQNFAGEIITVQKGVAHKIDGKWQVEDENKAKIKFQ